MKNIILIAPPAAGKGTQAEMISSKYNIPHISTGDLLRDEIKKETDLGLKIKEDMDKGNLVSDITILELLKSRLSKGDCNNGYILDGYPRNVNQALEYDKLLDSMNKELGIVIFFNIDKNLALKRTISRIVCPSCGMNYNLLVNDLKPKMDGICNKCNKELKIRSDDNEAVFLNRFDTFINNTEDLVNFYQTKGVLNIISVDEHKSALDIFYEIEGLL